MHLVLHEPEAFSGLRSKAMRFRGVENYIILAGRKTILWKNGAAITAKKWFYWPSSWD
mgnify:CR=1 FL=1